MLEAGHEFRCPSRIVGIITEAGLLEVKCSSKRCGAGNGVVVMHYFSTETGELKETRKFRDPSELLIKK